jgi:hypothetical protein
VPQRLYGSGSLNFVSEVEGPPFGLSECRARHQFEDLCTCSGPRRLPSQGSSNRRCRECGGQKRLVLKSARAIQARVEPDFLTPRPYAAEARRLLEAHLRAGADQVALCVLSEEGPGQLLFEQWERLADAITASR